MGINMPKFSIIVPVYNCEKDLPKCLDSLVGQTLSDIEILVVNDGSPDNSQTIIDDYVARYPNLIKAYKQENRGQSAARNAALDKATGEFVFFVDSDDYVDTAVCERTYDFAVKNCLDIVCFDYWTENGEDKTYCDHCVIKDVDTVRRYILNESSPWNKIIKRELLERSGMRFTENLIYEDFEMIPRLALYTSSIGYMEEAFYYYVIHEGSTMNQKKYTPKLKSIYTVMDTLKASFENTEYKKELEYLYIEHLMYFTVFRYLDYPEGVEDALRISDIMRKNFPKWYKNIYYKRKPFKYKVFLWLVHFKQIKLLKRLLHK